MKMFLKYVVMMLLGVVAFTSCKKPVEEKPVEVSFTFAKGEVTENSLSVEITPSVVDADYFAGVFESIDLDGLADDKIVEMALASDFSSELHRGVYTLSKQDLKSETEYTVVVFSYITEKAGKVFSNKMVTEAEDPDPELTLTISVSEITESTAIINVDPSDASAFWHNGGVYLSSALDGFDDAAIIDAILANYPDNKVSGAKEYTVKDLPASTEIVYVAFTYEDDKPAKLYKESFTTGEHVVGDFLPEIEVTDITATGATVTVTPNDDREYFARVVSTYELEFYGILEDDVEIVKYLKENPFHDVFVYTGTQVQNPTLRDGYEYMVCVFDYGDPLPDLFKKTFTTLEGGEVGDKFTVTNLTPALESCSAHVEPSESGYWISDWMKMEDYIRYGDGVVQNIYFGLQNHSVLKGFDNVGDYLASIAHEGPADIVFESTALDKMVNDTEYMGVLLYVDPSNPDPMNITDWYYQEVPFRTLAPKPDVPVSTIEISNMQVIDYDAYWDEYTITVNVKVNDVTVDLKCASTPYSNFATYYDPDNWENVKAFFWLRSVSSTALEEAKTENGTTITLAGITAGMDWGFCCEAKNEEAVLSYEGILIKAADLTL